MVPRERYEQARRKSAKQWIYYYSTSYGDEDQFDMLESIFKKQNIILMIGMIDENIFELQQTTVTGKRAAVLKECHEALIDS